MHWLRERDKKRCRRPRGLHHRVHGARCGPRLPERQHPISDSSVSYKCRISRGRSGGNHSFSKHSGLRQKTRSVMRRHYLNGQCGRCHLTDKTYCCGKTDHTLTHCYHLPKHHSWQKGPGIFGHNGTAILNFSVGSPSVRDGMDDQHGVRHGHSNVVLAKYGQCGGTGYSGPTTCAAGSTCKSSSAYYSQCL
ncbi:carbohydrate-binding module family 1 protein [Athelia psychrophila]|uniref:Carbohydrate-binding module family 1 protein n=1 Tax=Athelia psychrophila TaxID=1759441 RepID=A0A165XJC7_9AGAM|nr:carbohydrate-binding module family 1 protein [Fibularhizoctonia sp. CBS 109695]